MQTIIAQIRQQLQVLGYQADDNINIRLFGAKNCPKNLSAIQGTLKLEGDNAVFTVVYKDERTKVFNNGIDTLKAYNDMGYGVYFVVNPGGNSDSQITEARTLFFEFDNLNFDEQHRQIAQLEELLGQPVSLIVKTRKSLHTYLRLAAPITDLPQWQRYQERLIQHLDSDPVIKNPSRVLRLAGFNHVHWDNDWSDFHFTPIEIVKTTDSAFDIAVIDGILPAWDEDHWVKELTNRVPTDPNLDEWDSRHLVNYLPGLNYNGRKDYITCQCPHHQGQALDSLHIRKDTGAIKCHAGCDPKDVYNSMKEIALANGFNPDAPFAEPKVNTNKGFGDKEDKKTKKIRLRESIKEFLSLTDALDKIELRNTILSTFRIRRNDFEELCLEVTKGSVTERKEVKLFSLKEAFELKTASDAHLIPGWLAEKSSNLWTGLPGAGKTKIAIDLMYALVTGSSFLGVPVSRKCKVLFVNSDQPLETDTRNYLIDRGFDGTESLWILNNWDCTKMDLLAKLVEEHQFDVVIFDVLRAIICEPLNISENDAIVGKWLREIISIVNRYGTAIILHHETKSPDAKGVGKSSGNTAITSVPSAHWSIEADTKNPESLTRTLSIYKTRIGSTGKHQISIDPETNSFKYEGLFGEDPAKAKERQHLSNSILKLLAEYPVGTEVEGAEIAKKLGNSGVYVVLKRLVESKQLNCVIKIGKRGKLYSLPTNGETPIEASTTEVATELVEEPIIVDSDNLYQAPEPEVLPINLSPFSTGTTTDANGVVIKPGDTVINAAPPGSNPHGEFYGVITTLFNELDDDLNPVPMVQIKDYDGNNYSTLAVWVQRVDTL